MKGMSLAIETVIVLILAVSVLMALWFFFNKFSADAQQRAKWLSDRTTWCNSYVIANPGCKNDEHNSVDTAITTELGKVCPKLGYPCTSTPDIACIRKCCELLC